MSGDASVHVAEAEFMNAEKVLITGASAGIGEQTALAFAEDGSDLLLVARREDRLLNLAEVCRSKASARVEVFPTDLSRNGAGRTVVKKCRELLGGLDVLICNAGYGFFGPVIEVDPDAMRRMWQVNFGSAYESIHEALPFFQEQGSGHIVLVSSIIGKKGMPYSASYCATKFAQAGLGEALWGELRDFGVGVTVVCPGYTDTEFHGVAEDGEGALKSSRPIKGQAAEVVGRAILRAVRGNKREIHLTLPGKLILGINRISNGLATRIMTMAARMDRKRR